MGSKNLKAITVQGNGGIRVERPADMMEWSEDFRKRIDSNEAVYGFKRRGTLGAVEMYQHIGSHFWRNNQGNMFRGNEITSDNWVKKYHKYAEVCSSDCYIACDAKYKFDGTESEAAKKSMSAKRFADPNTSPPAAVPARWICAIGPKSRTGARSPTTMA